MTNKPETKTDIFTRKWKRVLELRETLGLSQKDAMLRAGLNPNSYGSSTIKAKRLGI